MDQLFYRRGMTRLMDKPALFLGWLRHHTICGEVRPLSIRADDQKTRRTWLCSPGYVGFIWLCAIVVELTARRLEIGQEFVDGGVEFLGCVVGAVFDL